MATPTPPTIDTSANELKQAMADIVEASRDAAQNFETLLTSIKDNNGVNPGVIESLITKGFQLVESLRTTVTTAHASVNPQPEDPNKSQEPVTA